MNQRTLVDVFPPVSQSTTTRNFIRENVLRVRNQRLCAPFRRNKNNPKDFAKIQQTRSMPNVDENHPSLRRSKPPVRCTVGRRNVTQPMSVIVCDRGIQTESMTEFQQAAPAYHHQYQHHHHQPLRRSTNFEHGDNQNASSSRQAPMNYGCRKDSLFTVQDNYHINGLVRITDDEHANALRLLMESYQDKIKEMNSLPMRNDTLKLRRRKMELDDELRKIDNGIKIFQRGHVFVQRKK